MRQSKATSSLDAAIRRETSSFEAEIAAFVSGAMPGDSRAQFVETLRVNRALRLAVGNFRSSCEFAVKVSEQAHSLLDEVLNGLHQSSPLFPGDPYIAGLENRSDIAPQRELWLNRTIEAAEKLIGLGELEDIALENKFRAEQNIINARRAQKDFGPSTAASAMEGAFEAIGREHWDPVSVRYDPYYLPAPPPDPAPLKFLVQNLQAGSQDSARVVSRLGELWGGERAYYYETGLREPAPDQETWEVVVSRVSSSAEFRRAIVAFIQRPFTTPEPIMETFSKIVGARLLLQYAGRANDVEEVKPIVERLNLLVASSQDIPLTKHSHNLAEGLAYLLALEGDESEIVWAAGGATLVSHVKAGTYGIPERENFGRADRTLVDALTKAENRLKSDLHLQGTVIECARGSDIPARYEALSGIEKLPADKAAHEILYQIASHKDERIPGKRGLDEDYPVNTVASHALCRLVRENLSWARNSVVDGDKISPALEGCKTIIDATERLYLTARNDPSRKEWDSGAMTSLLTALYHLDSERALPLIQEHFIQGPKNHYGHYPFIYMLRDLDLRQFLPEMLAQLSTSPDIGRDGDKVILEVLGSWGHRKSAVGRMLAQLPITRPVRHDFMELVREVDLPLTVDILRQALKQGLGQDAVWALRLARSNSTQRELEAEHVQILAGLLPETSAKQIGWLAESFSLGQDAFDTLKAWLAGPSKALVSRELDRISGELRDRASPGTKEKLKLEKLKSLQEHRDQLNAGVRPEVVKLEPMMAFNYLLAVVRPPAEILRLYLLSYSSKTEADLTPDQLAARRYCALALGDNFDSLHELHTISNWTNRKVNVAASEYAAHREDLAEADDYRYPAERPLHDITTAAIGLLTTDIGHHTEVFKVLREEFEKAHAVYTRFSEDKIEAKYFMPLIGGLVRLGKLAEAEAYLEKFQIEELGPLNGVIDVAIQTAKELVSREQATSALASMRFAERCVDFLPRSERGVAQELISRELKQLF